MAKKKKSSKKAKRATAPKQNNVRARPRTGQSGKSGQSSAPKRTPSKSAQNKPKLSKEKEGVIHRLLVALGLVKDKKQKKEEKYAEYNVGQIRPVNNKETRGHNGYLITKSGSGENAEFGYVSLTHSEITKKRKNVKLLQNPNPNDTKTSYAVNKAKNAKANELGDRKNGWRLNKKDKKTLKRIFNKKKKK